MGWDWAEEKEWIEEQEAVEEAEKEEADLFALVRSLLLLLFSFLAGALCGESSIGESLLSS